MTEAFQWSKFLSDLTSQALAAGFGAFAGALIAMRHERRRAREEQTEKNLVSANLALFTLNRMWKLTEAYENTILRQWFVKERAGQSASTPLWFNIGLTAPPDPVTRFDLERLAFLLDATDGKLIGEVGAAVESYAQLIGHIGTRIVLLRQAQSRWAVFQHSQSGMQYSDTLLRREIGEDLTAQLRTISVAVIREAYVFLQRVPELQSRLAPALCRRFDPQKIILYVYSPLEDELREPVGLWMDRYAEAISSR